MKTFSLGLLCWACAAVSGVPVRAEAAVSRGFVTVKHGHFELSGAPYAFVGTNFWYGMNLAVEGAAGDRARLTRELDRLGNLGVLNLRIMASTQGPESEPWRILPALETAAGVYDEKMLRGLDWLLKEMGSRGMRAVVCLGNFWPWSGGMSQYLNWSGASSIPYPPPAAGGSWDVYQTYTEKFYSDAKAVESQARLARAIVSRVNAYTGIKYSDDPAIMAWELSNEPRGGREPQAFNAWIESASRAIKSLDPHHLVTTGSEGETPWPAVNGLDLIKNHSYASIDYVTAHVWAQNWSWYNPSDGEAGLPQAVALMSAYLRKHASQAAVLGKPLVFEEFGLGRDGGSYDPASGTGIRDRYYEEVFKLVLSLTRQPGMTVSGVNFWAWAGEARPKAPFGGYWRAGSSFIGDPPHEAQGWYSVYDSDTSTLKVIQAYARQMSTSAIRD